MSREETSESNCRSCCSGKSDLSAVAWQRRYDDGRTGWDRGEPNPMITQWLGSRELQPCRILVPGCGRGHEAVSLAAAGFDVTAVDFAPSAVSHLRDELDRRGLQANVVQSDLFVFEGDDQFDAVYEQTCLCAIDPSQRETYEQLLARWLRPGGRLFALFMQVERTDDPPFPCDLSSMRTLFGSRNWNWMGDPVRITHPMGMHELGCVLSRQELKS